jgi:phage repressor protein C with HTH and peptisase S24 domain
MLDLSKWMGQALAPRGRKSAAAKALNTSLSSMTRLANGSKQPTPHEIAVVAKAFGLANPLEGLSDDLVRIDGRSTRMIPVYGRAVAGQDSAFIYNGDVFDEIPIPPFIDDEDAYGFDISGDSMEPRYLDGERCIATPNGDIRKNDHVVALIRNPNDRTAPPSAFVKKFVRFNSTELVLEQYNPSKTMTFQSELVVGVHLIAACIYL